MKNTFFIMLILSEKARGAFLMELRALWGKPAHILSISNVKRSNDGH